MFKHILLLTNKFLAIVLTVGLISTTSFAANCSSTREVRGGIVNYWGNWISNQTFKDVQTWEVSAVGTYHTHSKYYGSQNVTNGDIAVYMANNGQIPFYHFLEYGRFTHASDVAATVIAYEQNGVCQYRSPLPFPSTANIQIPLSHYFGFLSGGSGIPFAEFTTTLYHYNNQPVYKKHTADQNGGAWICPPIKTHDVLSAGGVFGSNTPYYNKFPTSPDGFVHPELGMEITLVHGGFEHNWHRTRQEIETNHQDAWQFRIPAATSIRVKKLGVNLNDTVVGIYIPTSSGWRVVNEYEVKTNALGEANFVIPESIAASSSQVAIGVTENGSTRLYGYYDFSSPTSVTIDHIADGRPNLIAPVPNATVSTPITFQWEDLSGMPNHGFYWVNIYQNGALYDDGGFIANSVSGLVYPAGRYEWEIEAYDADGYLYAVSNRQYFTIPGTRSAARSMAPSNPLKNKAPVSNTKKMESKNVSQIDLGTIIAPVLLTMPVIENTTPSTMSEALDMVKAASASNAVDIIEKTQEDCYSCK